MAEKVLEQQFCRTCGADIRRGALFCYNCGSSVAPEPVIAGNARAENSNGSKVTAAPLIEKPIEKPKTLLFEKNAQKSEGENTSPETNKLKSPVVQSASPGAAARKKIKTQAGKPVEVIWEAPEDSVNVWFVLTAIVLALFAVGILLAMLYIR